MEVFPKRGYLRTEGFLELVQYARRHRLGAYSESNQAKVSGDAARHERKVVPKRRFQKGCIRKETKQWFLYYWMDVNQDGVILGRVQSVLIGTSGKNQISAGS
jgi:hypothetical protein